MAVQSSQAVGLRRKRWRQWLLPLEDRGPLKVMFVITSMPVGGAESLLAELLRRMDRQRFSPELCCLKERGPLGEVLAEEVPTFAWLIGHKFDVAVLWRLAWLFRRRGIDAVVTVGAGDKMFWGRLAAWLADVPVVCAALHATGYPDRVERINRLLAPLTDAFIAVAEPHARHLVEHEGCPAAKVRVIPNGVDPEKFRPRPGGRQLKPSLGIPADAPVVGIVAALRPEKNHELFLRMAALVVRRVPEAHFLIVGDGPERPQIEQCCAEFGLSERVHLLGTRTDVAELLGMIDVVALTSRNEANPVSILEAMAAARPVVATAVGSVGETVIEGQTGHLVPPGDAVALASRVVGLLRDTPRAAAMGRAGREHVLNHWSVDRMVRGYEELLAEIYCRKCATPGRGRENGAAVENRPAGEAELCATARQ